MKEWFLSADLMDLPGMPTTTAGISNRARREGWKSRKAKGMPRALEYHISSFDEQDLEELRAKFGDEKIPDNVMALSEDELKSSGVSVAYYDIAASAGAGHLVEYVPSKRVELNEALKIALNIQNPNRSKLLNMEGDSMFPTLKDKSILAIETLDNFKQDGVYVFTFDNTLYVKRLQKSRDGIKVISDNPVYDAWFISREEVDTPLFMIHGRVTGCAQSV